MVKKKTTSRATASKTTRRATKKSGSAGQTVLIHRIFIVTACVAIFAAGALYVNNANVSNSVLGTSVMRGMSDEATIVVPADIKEAVSYNIYYKLAEEKEFTNSVQDVSPFAGSYTISYLKRGGNYEYRFAAVNKNGKEYMFSETLPLTNLRPM